MALCRRISYLYALALLTVYALFLPLGGYERMMEGKYRAFLLLSLGYVLAMTARAAEQHRRAVGRERRAERGEREIGERGKAHRLAPADGFPRAERRHR